MLIIPDNLKIFKNLGNIENTHSMGITWNIRDWREAKKSNTVPESKIVNNPAGDDKYVQPHT